ncbi:MAG: ABC transporter permease [Dehalococcoidia bacterium]
MRTYIVKRLLLAVLTVYGVATLVFVLMRIVPGDPALVALAEPSREGRVPEELIHDMRVKLGFTRVKVIPNQELLGARYGVEYPEVERALRQADPKVVRSRRLAGQEIKLDGYIIDPEEIEIKEWDVNIFQQYGEWLWGSLRLDFGESTKVGRPVLKEWLRRFPMTLNIVVMSGAIVLLTAIPMGVISAIRQDKPVDYVARVIAIAGLSMPSFWVAMLLLLLLITQFQWLPSLEYVAFWHDPAGNLTQSIFPAIAVAFVQVGVIARMTRSSLLEVLREDYIRTAWAKGLRERLVVQRHALKNAFLPVLTIFGLQLGFSIGGIVVVETAFNLPGLGLFLVESVTFRDYPAIQATLFATAIFVTAANLIVDLMYGWLNPRVRYQ